MGLIRKSSNFREPFGFLLAINRFLASTYILACARLASLENERNILGAISQGCPESFRGNRWADGRNPLLGLEGNSKFQVQGSKKSVLGMRSMGGIGQMGRM
jgi:hypothetical protein